MIYKKQQAEIIIKEIELLPCPFCGSDDIEPIFQEGSYGYSYSFNYVQCNCCKARGGLVKDGDCMNNEDKAIRNWNSRRQAI